MEMGLTFEYRLMQLELKELARAVNAPLESWLHSFKNMLDMLLSVNADMVLPECQTFHDIRQEIENMKQQMEKSELVAGNELQRLDGETGRLTAEQSDLANQRRQRESELEKLMTQLESHRSCLESYSKALERAKKALKSAENIRGSMRQKRGNAQTIRNVGIGLMFIPILGTIPGAVMVGVGQADMNRAGEAADIAENEIENCESQVRLYIDKMETCRSLITKAERDIQEVDLRIRKIETKRRRLSVKREVVADVQAKVRNTVHQLGLLCGVGSVAELQTRRLIKLEPVMKVMEEMTTALGQITEDDLLQTERIKTLIFRIKKNHNKLLELHENRVQSSDLDLDVDVDTDTDKDSDSDTDKDSDSDTDKDSDHPPVRCKYWWCGCK